jgi:hypothetical protein
MAEMPIRYGARVDRAKLASFRDGVKIGAFLIRKWYLASKGDGNEVGENDRLAPETKQVT